ncbi:substrate-binding protein domain-containing protein [Burkholderia sp. OK233]|nr:substrate-binding protein domain-containing protein [Burkholderia sp. OK233]
MQHEHPHKTLSGPTTTSHARNRTARARAAANLLAAALALTLAPIASYAKSIFDVDLATRREGDQSQFSDIRTLCGTKPLRVALADGFGGNSWRKIVHAEFVEEAKKCPNITEVRYTDAQGDVQKHIADIQSLAAQHFDVIVLYPDGGEALLHAMRRATAAGIAVVPFAVGETFAGTPGRDYLSFVTEDLADRGRLKARWIAQQLHGKGNVVVLGGTPGNPSDAAEAAGWKQEWSKNWPQITVLEGPVVTNWDPAQVQKVTSGLIAKYPQIDAVFFQFGAGTLAVARAFEAAGRQLPLQVTDDANGVACLWKQRHEDFRFATTSARTWLVRLALRKGVAAAEGIADPEPSIVKLPLFEDSTSTNAALQPRCVANLPPDAELSSTLTPAQLAAALK